VEPPVLRRSALTNCVRAQIVVVVVVILVVVVVVKYKKDIQ